MTVRRLALALGMAVAGSILAVTSTMGAALAADPPQPTTLTVNKTADQQPGKPVLLSAKLTDSKGQPLGNQIINFFVIPGLFGPDGMMRVGKATTDGTGVAQIPYTPTWIGDVKAAANFTATATLAGSQSSFQFKTVGPVRGHKDAEFGLKTVREVAPWVVAALVAAIWATFITVVVRMAIAMRTGEPTAPSPTIAGEHLAGAKT